MCWGRNQWRLAASIMRLGRSTRELELAALQTERGRGDQSIKTFPPGFFWIWGVCLSLQNKCLRFFLKNVLGWGHVLRTIRRRRRWPWRHILGLAPDPISPQLTRILWELVAPEKWVRIPQDFYSTASALIIRTV